MYRENGVKSRTNNMMAEPLSAQLSLTPVRTQYQSLFSQSLFVKNQHR